MRIVMEQSLEDCFSESLSQEIRFDCPIGESFIRYIGSAGELQYFPHFSRPLFKVDVPGRYGIVGIQGNDTLKLTLCRDNKEDNIRHFKSMVQRFDSCRQ